MSTHELISKVRGLKELKALTTEPEAETASLEDSIKAEMTAGKTDEMRVDVFTVRWTKAVSRRFDTVSFKKNHADLYERYTKQAETRRFSVA